MYKVILYPSKCTKINSWIHQCKDGDVKIVSNEMFQYHDRHHDNCMKPIEHYKMITVSKKVCKECGSIVLKRKKVMIEKFEK